MASNNNRIPQTFIQGQILNYIHSVTTIPVYLGNGFILEPEVFIQDMDFNYSRENGG